MLYKVFTALILLVFFTACSDSKPKELRIATNAWIGYAPLFYADKMGDLEQLHMKLLYNVSLTESTEIYSVGKADMVTTTQYEYYTLSKTNGDIVPIILLDRSYGGDMILSNKTLQEIKSAKQIDAYLEIESVNSVILKDFMKKFHLDKNRINFINLDQQQILDVENDPKKVIIIATYNPYNITLEKKGFKLITSTKDEGSIIVIDALCARKTVYEQEKARLEKLKRIVDKYIDKITNDPKEAYKNLKQYLGNITYQEFIESREMIQWINHPTPKLLDRIEKLGYTKETIIR